MSSANSKAYYECNTEPLLLCGSDQWRGFYLPFIEWEGYGVFACCYERDENILNDPIHLYRLISPAAVLIQVTSDQPDDVTAAIAIVSAIRADVVREVYPEPLLAMVVAGPDHLEHLDQLQGFTYADNASGWSRLFSELRSRRSRAVGAAATYRFERGRRAAGSPSG